MSDELDVDWNTVTWTQLIEAIRKQKAQSSLAAPPCSAYGRALIDGSEIKAVFESLEDCRAQGQAAADQGYRREQNPYPQGTQRREWWDAGWCESGEELCGER